MSKEQQLIQQVAEKMIRFRRELHQFPEPAFEEYRTASRIMDWLQIVPGLKIQSGIGNTGIVAILGEEKSGPCVALRADMDCLRLQEENRVPYSSKHEGLMHGCGHDGHVACLVGTALVLNEMKNELSGPVKFIFQPAEENLGGATKIIEEGGLLNPKVSAIFGLHGTMALPLGTIGLGSGPMMAASRYFTITVKGKGCHAASPHRGVDPVYIGSQIICSVQSIIARNIDPFETALISIPQFFGSSAPNVIPEKAVLKGTLRALSNTVRQQLEIRLTEVVEHCARAHGGEANVELYGGYPLLINDENTTRYVHHWAQTVLGDRGVVYPYKPSLGAEDFAFYLQEIPGTFFWLGLQPEGENRPSLHHPCFDFNDDALAHGISLFVELAKQQDKLAT